MAKITPMTKEQFLVELRAHGKEFKWAKTGFLRGTGKRVGINQKEPFCPITAVCYALTGSFHSTCFWDRAAREIKLPKSIGSTIVRAADCHDLKSFHDLKSLRAELVKAIGGK